MSTIPTISANRFIHVSPTSVKQWIGLVFLQ